jgi:hypothetical protein
VEQPDIKALNARSQLSMNVKTVHKQNGRLAIGNGPYAETKEQMSGVYILNCKDLDESLEYAWKLPVARLAIVEIHRLLEF